MDFKFTKGTDQHFKVPHENAIDLFSRLCFVGKCSYGFILSLRHKSYTMALYGIIVRPDFIFRLFGLSYSVWLVYLRPEFLYMSTNLFKISVNGILFPTKI